MLFVGSRQHAPAFPGLPGPMLASTSSQSPYPSPNRANTLWVFPICRRLCWRRPLRKAFVLRRATPTRPSFFQSAGAHVGVALLAKPLSFAEPRQHAPAFSGLPAPMLAPCSPQGLITSSGHANMVRVSQVCRCPCWRLVPRKALSLRPATPTWSGFPRFAGAHVGVALLGKPLSFAEPRQHALGFSNLRASLLAPTSPQSLCPSSSHANTPQLFQVCQCPCWRRPHRKAFTLRRAAPTRPGFFRFAGAHVGVYIRTKPLPFVESRQHAPAFPDLPAPMLASPSSQRLYPSPGHTNTQKYRIGNLCNTKREENGFTDFLSFFFLQKFVRAEIIQR